MARPGGLGLACMVYGSTGSRQQQGCGPTPAQRAHARHAGGMLPACNPRLRTVAACWLCFVDMQAGDRVVIASSSFFPEEVDEAVITAVTYLSNNRTMLNVSAPLRYTHLGVVVAVAGEPRTLDMRAEVAVLSRNVLVTVRLHARVGTYTTAHSHMSAPCSNPSSRWEWTRAHRGGLQGLRVAFLI
jgi:hypothetical protein